MQFEKLISILEDLGTYFERITSNEIVVPCVALAVSGKEEALLPDAKLAEADVPFLTDEIYVHIALDKSGELNWSVAYINNSEEEEN